MSAISTDSAKKTSRLPILLGIAAISVIYFVDVILRATSKHFWFDELATIFICRLPNMAAVWAALIDHGADFNPPLFYFLTRASQSVFGEGLIGSRIPEMLGVWIFCLCLFQFVSSRSGSLAGFIAGIFPLLTEAKYYAYEARPHGIVLGFCGIAVVCWQLDVKGSRRWLSLTGFGLSLAAAFLTHFYAILLLFPFGVAEIYRFVKSRRLDWSVWITMAGAASFAAFFYIPLLRAFRLTVITPPAVGSFLTVQRFYVSTFGSAMLILLIALALFAFSILRPSIPNRPLSGSDGLLPGNEVAIAVGFMFLPVVGAFVVRLAHGIFFDRYFLSALVGFSIVIGSAAGARHLRPWISATLATAMFLLYVKECVDLTNHRMKHVDERLVEPSSGMELNTTPGKPLAGYALLLTADKSLDVAALSIFDFMYLYYYSPDLVNRLHYCGWRTDALPLKIVRNLGDGARLNLQAGLVKDFISSHRRFLLYGDRGNLSDLSRLVEAGGRIKAFGFENHHFLAEIEMQ